MMAPSKAVRTAKRCHFTFTFLYALISMTVFLLPFIFINYVSTFQFSAVATVHLITGVLAAGLVGYGVLVQVVWDGKKGAPADELQDDAAAHRFFNRTLMAMYGALAVILAVCITLNLAAIGIQLYNLLVILFVECPQLCPAPVYNWSQHSVALQENTHWFQGVRHDPLKQQRPNTLDIVINYQEQERQHILLLKYNLTDRHIVQHSRPKEPQHSGWLQSQAVSLAQERSPVCTSATYSNFLHLESEITEALERRQTRYNAQKSVVIQGHDVNAQSSEVEDRIFFNMMMRTICRNEYGFVIFLIVFLLLIALMDFILMGWFLYVRRRHYH